MSKRTRWILLGILALLLVAAIVLFFLFLPVSSPTKPAPSSAPTGSVTSTSTAKPIAADALVIVRATATDASGARLALTMVVHRPVAKTDPAVADDLALLTADCASNPNLHFATDEPQSGIERIDVTAAQLGDAAWPQASEIPIMPLSGMIKTDTGPGIEHSVSYLGDPPPSACENVFSVFGEAEGTLHVFLLPWEIQGDPIESPNTYRWVHQEYGFFASLGPGGPVSISNCTVEVTDAASAFGWRADLWQEHEDDPYSCFGTGVLL
jgi:hypothetical protein